MIYAMICGMVITLAMMFRERHRHIIRIEWNKVSSFLAFLAFVTCIRIAGFEFLADFAPPGTLPSMNEKLLNVPIWRFVLVFWEDAFFGIPLYYAWKYCRRWFALLVTIGFSVWFGFGHGYQGNYAIVLTALYPYFISYRFGSQYGFGTVMVSHIMYDMATYYTILYASQFF